MHLSRNNLKLFPAVLAAASLLTITACSSGSTSSMPGMDMGSSSMTSTMPGMSGMASGDGLSDSQDGLTLKDGGMPLTAGAAVAWTFQILGPDGKPVTKFTPEQTKLMHFHAIRNDLTGYQHVHPTMAQDGTWTADLSALAPGRYRFYTQFTADGNDGKPVTPILSVEAAVPGDDVPEPLPAASPTTQVEGFTVTIDTSGGMMAGHGMPLKVTIAKDGQPVKDLQPYLDSYAHLTAIHEQDLAFAHLHPENAVTGDNGGPELDFEANLPEAGNWRLFIQFQVDGVLHTAAVTLSV